MLSHDASEIASKKYLKSNRTLKLDKREILSLPNLEDSWKDSRTSDVSSNEIHSLPKILQEKPPHPIIRYVIPNREISTSTYRASRAQQFEEPLSRRDRRLLYETLMSPTKAASSLVTKASMTNKKQQGGISPTSASDHQFTTKTCLHRPWSSTNANISPPKHQLFGDIPLNRPSSFKRIAIRNESNLRAGRMHSPPPVNRVLSVNSNKITPRSVSSSTLIPVKNPHDSMHTPITTKTLFQVHDQIHLSQQRKSSISLIERTSQGSQKCGDKRVNHLGREDYSLNSVQSCIQQLGSSRLQIYKSALPVAYFPPAFFDNIVFTTETYVSKLSAGWQTRKLYSLTQQDVAICDVPNGWAIAWPLTRFVLSTVKKVYKQTDVYMDRNQPHVLKYDCEYSDSSIPAKLQSSGVRLHCDRCNVTVNVLLSRSSDYIGGGTYIQALDRTIKLEQGEMLLHRGDLVHGGCDITSGTRYLLVYFIQFGPLNLEQKRCSKLFPF